MRGNPETARGPGGGFRGAYPYLAALIVLIATLAVASACSPLVAGDRQRTEFKSNGEQIYFTATSERGDRITADWRRGMMGGSRVACADCHGPQGRGGRLRMMMSTVDVPDIRYETLTSDTGDEGMEHPPYTDETIKRAITAGVDPGGEPLEWPMPRWDMKEEDLDDLLAFIKALSQEQP